MGTTSNHTLANEFALALLVALDYDFCCLFEGKADEWEARRENIRMSIQEDDNNSAFHFCADSRQEMNFRLGVGHFNVPCAHHWHASHVLIR